MLPDVLQVPPISHRGNVMKSRGLLEEETGFVMPRISYKRCCLQPEVNERFAEFVRHGSCDALLSNNPNDREVVKVEH